MDFQTQTRLDLIVLYLLREELKARVLHNKLIEVGFNSNQFFNATHLIMLLVGLNSGGRGLQKRYYEILDRHARLVTSLESDLIESLAVQILQELHPLADESQ